MAKIKSAVACAVSLCVIISAVFLGVSYFNYAENSDNSKFQAEMVSLYQKYDPALSTVDTTNPFALKRLIVSNYDGKNYGAVDVVEDTKHSLALLQYDTCLDASNAYDRMINDGYIVDPDYAATLNSYEKCQMNPTGSDALGISSFIPSFNITADDVLVAVLDTGVMLNHDDLSGRFYNDGYDYSADGNENAEYDKSCESVYFHGTFVSGIIANNTMDNVKIIPFKVVPFGTNVETLSACISAIYAATDMGVDVINASFTSSLGEASYQKAVDYAVDNGVCVCASAGNKGSLLTNSYPAMTPGVITVSALNSNLTGIASYSNYGAEVDFCAPGSSVNSAIPNTDGSSGYASYSGTSFSAPYVAAVCANIKSMNTDLTKAQVYEIMTDFAIDYGDSGLDSYYGYGMPNIGNITYQNDDYSLSLPQGDLTVYNTIDYSTGGQPWSLYSNKILNVTVDSSVNSIGSYSFYDMSNAVFDISSNFISVGDYAFYGCSGLDGIAFDQNVKYIGNGAFGNISEGFEITGYSNTCAETYCNAEGISFNSLGCNHDFLTELFAPSGDDSGYTKYTCSVCGYSYNGEYISPAIVISGICGDNLSFSLNNLGVLSIDGTGAMYDYMNISAPWSSYKDSIRTVSLGEGITYISPFAFYGCNRIYSYSYTGDNYQVINRSLYSADGKTLVCSALTTSGEFVMPDSLENLEATAFLNASSLTIVSNDKFTVSSSILYDSVGNIVMALPSYKSPSLTIDSAINVQPYAFLLTQYPNAVRVYSSGSTFADYSIGYGYNDNGIVKNDLIYYGDADAEAYQYAVDNGFEANSLNTGNCGEDLSWHYDYDTKTLSISGSGEMYSYSTADSVPWYDYMAEIQNIVIDDNATWLSQYAFYNAKSAKELTMPLSMSVPVNQSVWYGCSSFETITLTQGSGTMPGYNTGSNHQLYTYTPWYISSESLQSLNLSSDVKYIGDSAFRGCKGIKSVTLNDCESVGRYAFYDCVNLISITNYSKQTVFATKALLCNSVENVNVPVVYCYNDSTTKDYISDKSCGFVSLGCGHSRGYTEDSTLPNCCYDVTVNYNCVDCNETVYSNYLSAQTKGHFVKATVKSTKGKPIADAEVYINGELCAVTNKYGKFVADEIKCCLSYNVLVKKHGSVIATTTIAPNKTNLKGELVIKYGDFIKDGIVNGKDFGYAHYNRFDDESLLDYGYVQGESLNIDTKYTNQGNPVVTDIYNEQNESASNKRDFYAHVNLGTEYTVTECGFLYGKNQDEDFMILENAGQKGSSGFALRQITFEPNSNIKSVTYGSSDSTGVVSARLYIKYTNGVKTYTYYSNVSSYTY
ncbi:MAG: S8 family serine peptidase [Eubacterium sp.]